MPQKKVSGFQGHRLRMRREEMDLSQEQLAQRVGVDQRQISRWELGASDLRISTLIKLVDVLNVDVNWLMGLSDDHVIDKRQIISQDEAELLDAIHRADGIEATTLLATLLQKNR